MWNHIEFGAGAFSTLFQQIASRNDYGLCLSKKLLSYAAGRSILAEESCAYQNIGDSAVTPDQPISELLSAIVQSPSFQNNLHKEGP